MRKMKTKKEILQKQRDMLDSNAEVNKQSHPYQQGYYQALCWVLGDSSI